MPVDTDIQMFFSIKILFSAPLNTDSWILFRILLLNSPPIKYTKLVSFLSSQLKSVSSFARQQKHSHHYQSPKM